MPEHQNIEYKQSWRDEYLKWICGFANAQGGKIFIGIDDNGEVTGVENFKNLMDELPNKTINHLGLVVDVNLHIKENKHYIEIDVPVSRVPISFHGAYHYRTGSTKQELKGSSLQEFLLKKSGRSWDDLLVDNASLYDLDSELIMQFYEQSVNIGRTPSYSGNALTLLKKLYLAKDHDSLTNAGILLFGKDPLKYFITATFKIGRFGKSSSELITQDVIEGNILEMADRILDILRAKYLKSLISYQGLKRIETLEYPEAALREAILNAIVHKDYANTYNYLRIYDDRLVIWNPGKLPFELTIERLKTDHSSVQRNPHIAGIFFKAGYIEAWGRGISKIIEACQAAGLPEPIFEEYQEGFRVTFLKDIFTEEYLKELGLADRYVKALIYIKSNGSITNSEYQKLLNVSKRTSTNDLQFLVDQNLILRTGTIGRGTHYKLAVRQA